MVALFHTGRKWSTIFALRLARRAMLLAAVLYGRHCIIFQTSRKRLCIIKFSCMVAKCSYFLSFKNTFQCKLMSKCVTATMNKTKTSARLPWCNFNCSRLKKNRFVAANRATTCWLLTTDRCGESDPPFFSLQVDS
uniref:Uncharacterized protein n=1 Tax=Rhipicephalus zambeziensis TaxID=60191 RepID=A0A224YJD9_9ACAR